MNTKRPNGSLICASLTPPTLLLLACSARLGSGDPAPLDPAAASAGASTSIEDPDCKNIQATCESECASLDFWDCAGYHVACLAGDNTSCCYVAMCDGDCQTDCVSSCDCTGTPPGPPPKAGPPFLECAVESAVALRAAPPKETNGKTYCEEQCPSIQWEDCIGYDLACGESGNANVCCWAGVCDAKLFGSDASCVDACQTCEALQLPAEL